MNHGAALLGSKPIELLEEAMALEPPPFLTPLYQAWLQEAAANPSWTAFFLLANIQDDVASAEVLRSHSSASSGVRALAAGRDHLADQGVALAAEAFPGALPAGLLEQLRGAAPSATRAGPSVGASSDLAEGVLAYLAERRVLARCAAVLRALRAGGDTGATGRLGDLADGYLAARHRQATTAQTLVDALLSPAPAMPILLLTSFLSRHIRATAEDTIDYSYHLRFGAYP